MQSDADDAKKSARLIGQPINRSTSTLPLIACRGRKKNALPLGFQYHSSFSSAGDSVFDNKDCADHYTIFARLNKSDVTF